MSYQVNVETDALILVDVQRDFCPGGALAVPASEEIMPLLNQWLDIKNLLRIATRDSHPPNHCSFRSRGGDWPEHCIRNSPGAEFYPALNADAIDIIMTKGADPNKDARSAFDGPELLILLRTHDFLRLWIGGLAHGSSIKATALDARKYHFQVFVIEDAIRNIDADPGDYYRARREMETAGVVFVTSQEVTAEQALEPNQEEPDESNR